MNETPLYLVETMHAVKEDDEIREITSFWSIEAINLYDARQIAKNMYKGKIVNIVQIGY